MESTTEIKTEVIYSSNQETHLINNDNNENIEKIENENKDENNSSSTKKVVLKKNVRKLKAPNQNEQSENIPIENIEIEVNVETPMNNKKEITNYDNINEKKEEIIIQNEIKINNEFDNNDKNEVKGYLDDDFDDEDNKKIYLRVVKRLEKTYGVPFMPAELPGEPIEDIEIEENIRPILINNENKKDEQKGNNNKNVPIQNNINKNKENIEINNNLPKNIKYEVEQRRANEKSNYIPNNMNNNNKINYNKTGKSQYNPNPINYNKFVNSQVPNKNNYNNNSNHIEYYMSDSQNKYNNNYVNRPNSRYNYNDNKNINNRPQQPQQYIYNSQNIYNDNNYRPNKNISNSQNIYISDNNNYNKRPQNISKSQNNYDNSGNYNQNKYNNYIYRPEQNIPNSQKKYNTNYINRPQQHKSNSQKNYNNNIYINRPQQYVSNSQNKNVNRPQQYITNSQNIYNSRYDNIPKRNNISSTGYNQRNNGPKINNVDLNLYNNNINLKNEYMYQRERRNTPNNNISNIPYNKKDNPRVKPNINNQPRGYSYQNPSINLQKRYEKETPKFNYNTRYQDNSNSQFDRRRTPNNSMIPDKNQYINVGRSLQLCDMNNPKRYNNFNMRKTYYIINSRQQNMPGNPKGVQNTGKLQNKNNNNNYYVTRSLMNNKSPVIPKRENLQNYQVNYKNNYKDNNNLNNRYLVSSSQTFNKKSVNENITPMNHKKNISLYKSQNNYNIGDLNLNDNNRRNNRNNSQNQFVRANNNVNYLSRKPNNTPNKYTQDIQFNFNHYNY